MKHPLLILLFLVYYSLFSQGKIEYEKLEGTWLHVHSLDHEGTIPARGIAFNKDSLEILEGVFEKDSTRQFAFNDYFYKGGKLNYSIIEDSIFIINITYREKEFFGRIAYLSNDSLSLEKKNGHVRAYRKFEYKTEANISFDQIVIYTTTCYGFCPLMGISLNKNGHFLIQGEAYTKDTGIVQGWLNQHQTNFIFEKFSKVDYNDLDKMYAAPVTDDVTYSATIFHNGEKQQSVSMYGYSGPKELQWAFVPIQNLYTINDLRKLELPDSFSVFPIRVSFKSQGDSTKLLPSDSFFLWTELLESPVTNKSFTSTFDIKYSYNKMFPNLFYYWKPGSNEKSLIKKIETDGRHYRLYLKNGESITHDLGYNFIERNF